MAIWKMECKRRTKSPKVKPKALSKKLQNAHKELNVRRHENHKKKEEKNWCSVERTLCGEHFMFHWSIHRTHSFNKVIFFCVRSVFVCCFDYICQTLFDSISFALYILLEPFFKSFRIHISTYSIILSIQRNCNSLHVCCTLCNTSIASFNAQIFLSRKRTEILWWQVNRFHTLYIA